MKITLVCGLLAVLLLSGCTVLVIEYYYRQMDHSSRWQCSHTSGADQCSVTVGDAEIDVSSLDKIKQAAAADASEKRGDYGLEVRILAAKTPVVAELFKTHLQLPDGSVLAPILVTQVSGVMDAGQGTIGADPQQVSAKDQAGYELRFPLDALPDAYILSLAPMSLAGKQHSPPLLAMRIEYGSN
jgi:hypothetical protein